MRVLLLHEGWEAALYLTVELARLGVRVTLAGSSEPSLLRRYAEAVRAVDIRSAPGREGLSQLISSTPWDAVIATTEELLFAVFDSHAVPIEKIWPRLDPKFLPIMRDRRLVDQFVRSLGVRMPRLIVVGERSLPRRLKRLACLASCAALPGAQEVRFDWRLTLRRQKPPLLPWPRFRRGNHSCRNTSPDAPSSSAGYSTRERVGSGSLRRKSTCTRCRSAQASAPGRSICLKRSN